MSVSSETAPLANTCPTPAAYATLALVLAVCAWFTADNRLLANAGLVVCGLVAALVYRRVWVRLRTQAHAELVDVFEWCQGCNELAPRASMAWLTPELYRRPVPRRARVAPARRARRGRQPAQQATGRDARESGPGGSDIFRTRPPARASVSDARSREAGSNSSVSNTHFVGTA